MGDDLSNIKIIGSWRASWLSSIADCWWLTTSQRCFSSLRKMSSVCNRVGFPSDSGITATVVLTFLPLPMSRLLDRSPVPTGSHSAIFDSTFQAFLFRSLWPWDFWVWSVAWTLSMRLPLRRSAYIKRLVTWNRGRYSLNLLKSV